MKLWAWWRDKREEGQKKDGGGGRKGHGGGRGKLHKPRESRIKRAAGGGVVVPTVEEARIEQTGAVPLKEARRERMALAIANGSTQVDAYLDAGYTAKDRDRASRNASAVMRSGEMRRRVAYLKGLVQQTTEDRKARVIEELERLGFASLTDVVQWSADGITLRDSDGLDPGVVAAVKSIKMVEKRDGSVEFKIDQHDKIKALQELAVIHGARPEGDAGDRVTVVVVAPEKVDAAEWARRYSQPVEHTELPPVPKSLPSNELTE